MYSHLPRVEPTYRSVNNSGLCNIPELQTCSDHTLHFNKHVPDHISKHLTNKSCKYIVISGLEILIHHCIHECIIISYISIDYSPFHAYILQIEVFIQFTYSCTFSTMIFTSIYSLNLSQFHEPKTT